MNDRTRPLDAADETWLEHALSEVCRGESPPDLAAAVAAAPASQRAAAAIAVAAAGRTAQPSRWLAVAAALLGLGVVFAVTSLRERRGAAASQEPAAEIAVGDGAALARLLPEVTSLSLVARSGANGARLPDAPEHAAMLVDATLRSRLLAALGENAAVGAAFPLGEAQAELLLHVGKRLVRGRLRFDGTTATFGTAAFMLADGLPADVAARLRAEWQALAASPVPARRKLQVASLRELIAAIGSERTIELTSGPFVLDASDGAGELPANPNAVFVDSPPRLELRDVHDLHLRALGGPVRVLGKSPADVLTVVRSRGLHLEGLVLGHVEGLAGFCSAPVVSLVESRDVVLRDCELFGCGTEGVVANKSENVALERCEVHTCRHGVVRYSDCAQLRFVGSTFRDCGIAQNGFVFADCRDVAFVDCAITGMDSGDVAGGDGRLFEVRMDDAVRFTRGAIRGNRCVRVANSKLLLVRDGTDERDNGPDVELPRK